MARLIYDVLAIIRVTGAADEQEAKNALYGYASMHNGYALEIRESWDAEPVTDSEKASTLAGRVSSVSIPAPLHVELREMAEGLTEDYDEEVVAHATGKRMLEILGAPDSPAVTSEGEKPTVDAELRAYIDGVQSVLTKSLTIAEIGDVTGFWKAGMPVEEALAKMSNATVWEAP